MTSTPLALLLAVAMLGSCCGHPEVLDATLASGGLALEGARQLRREGWRSALPGGALLAAGLAGAVGVTWSVLAGERPAPGSPRLSPVVPARTGGASSP
jgi:hypothetical protein